MKTKKIQFTICYMIQLTEFYIFPLIAVVSKLLSKDIPVGVND